MATCPAGGEGYSVGAAGQGTAVLEALRPNQRKVLIVKRFARRRSETVKRVDESFPLAGAHVAKDASNSAAPVPGDLVDEGLPICGEGQSDIAAIGGKVTAIKESSLEQSVTNPAGI